MARPLPKAMTITDAAAERVKELISRSDKPIIGLRVGVKARGCSGMSYFVEYAEEKKLFEEVVEDKGVTILIDPAATMFLIGSEMDYSEDKFQSGFTFKNPNEKARCGCGESFMV
ncbi:iron-sulfur cluster assembly accessory protein [Niveispirillum sp. SYP-B3756]|jgi:iron-sulfur cluster assembly protein|uniref:HesB/IscA family protein n=1 Tax=unclassified Niveispirillum TaxID=2649257 RepID=UPI001291849A|nr:MULTISPECIES: iron-sulfur cluster assembly accessory protein [unclassified Niveispirillum]MDG5496710.1 iron-sulfur cluster assembly accessory protein [Niveispirillum sp. BGYR6]MQP66804.1 iron-sulfur cluster assembly accessory protein [Niveispirillum sp. SYP-B3756]